MKTDIYDRITSAIVAELEKGVRPWLKPWNAEHAAGLITRPQRELPNTASISEVPINALFDKAY